MLCSKSCQACGHRPHSHLPHQPTRSWCSRWVHACECKWPSEESNSKLKMSTPASARPAIRGDADDSFTIDDDRDAGQSWSWNIFWNEPRTRHSIPNSFWWGWASGNKSHLVDTFGDLWRTQSREAWCTGVVLASGDRHKLTSSCKSTAHF